MYEKRSKDVVLRGEWTGGLWDIRPITVPASVDVAEFLAAVPVPPIWPGDEVFARAMGPDDNMRRLWIVVFLHHPADDVVAQALASPYLDSSLLHSVTVADLLVEGRVPDNAAAAVWRLDDRGVAQVLTVVLNRGAAPSGHSPAAAQRALERLRRTCPPDRREYLESQVG
ncbi:hypothetical protein GCM10029964_046090 [Kibdelosporangium lantanae]